MRINIALFILLIAACRTASPTSEVRVEDASSEAKYPFVDTRAPESLTLYDTSPQAYRAFSGLPDDQAELEGWKIIGLIKNNQSRDGTIVPQLGVKLDLIEEHLLNGTAYEPISLPKRAILKKLKDYQRKYWRHAPGVDWAGPQEVIEGQEDSRKIYGTLDTFPKSHKLSSHVGTIYPLKQCLGRFRVAPWGPLQINYFCMVPGVYRGCYRTLAPGIPEKLLSETVKNEPLLYDAGTSRTSREVILLQCLTHRSRRDDPLWDQLAKELWFPQKLNLNSGPALFDYLAPTDAMAKKLDKIIDRVNLVPTARERKDIEFFRNRVSENFRDFYRDQYLVIDGQTINLFNYIMFAPVLKFKISDQVAILNSLYKTMSEIQPDGSGPYWPSKDASCPVADHVQEHIESEGRGWEATCDPKEFVLKTFAASSGR